MLPSFACVSSVLHALAHLYLAFVEAAVASPFLSYSWLWNVPPTENRQAMHTQHDTILMTESETVKTPYASYHTQPDQGEIYQL
jgi:hypothetical protein